MIERVNGVKIRLTRFSLIVDIVDERDIYELADAHLHDIKVRAVRPSISTMTNRSMSLSIEV